MKALEQAGYETVALDELEGPVVVLYANGDEYAPLKVVNKYAKQFASDKTSKTAVKFLGAWYDKKWNNGEYVTELANIPSREELLSNWLTFSTTLYTHLHALLIRLQKNKKHKFIFKINCFKNLVPYCIYISY